jgi:SM-20-related protein
VDDLVERGWSVYRHFLPEDCIHELAREAEELWKGGSFHQAGVGSRQNFQMHPEIRRDWVLWLEPENLSPPQKIFWEAIAQLRLKLNEQLFLGLREFEAHFAIYPPGAFYKKHLDQFQNVKHRIISCILYLNEKWNKPDGGQLRLYQILENDQETHIDIYPEAGTFVCFRSDSIYHEVLPSRRERFSLTGWLKRPSLHGF